MRQEDYIFTVIAVFFVTGSVWAYVKSDFVKILGFMYYSRKSGPSGFFTIAILRDIVLGMMKDTGGDLSRLELDIAHDFGHRYKGVVSVRELDGSTSRYRMEITADDSGNIDYEIKRKLR